MMFWSMWLSMMLCLGSGGQGASTDDSGNDVARLPAGTTAAAAAARFTSWSSSTAAAAACMLVAVGGVDEQLEGQLIGALVSFV
jgi:hypothetical protein